MYQLTDEIRNWISEHIADEPTKLRLAWHNKAPWINAAINHIENFKNTRRKFNSTFPGSEKLLPEYMPIKISTEQASSTPTAFLHRELAELEGVNSPTILDMTCGLGIDTSFLGSIPNANITTIELNEDIWLVAKNNFAHRSNIEVINADSVEFLKNTKQHYNLIFIDPARRDSSGGRVFNLHDCNPDVIEILSLLKQHGDKIMIKMSPMLDVTQTIRDLPGIVSLHIIELQGECRELLAIIEDKQLIENPKIFVWRNGDIVFSFTHEEETAANVFNSMPAKGYYLYEPSAAIMKAAPFKLLSQQYMIGQLGNNTHLYTSEKYIPDFPGAIYEIDDVLPYSSSVIKNIARQKLKADVAVRNFSISAQDLKKRLKIQSSGDLRIMGVTTADNKPYLLLLNKR